jgi:hypothetical protein
MASADLSRRVGKVVGYPPLCDMGDAQRREFHEALLDADAIEDLPGKWPAAIVRAEQERPDLRVVRGDEPGGACLPAAPSNLQVVRALYYSRPAPTGVANPLDAE